MVTGHIDVPLLDLGGAPSDIDLTLEGSFLLQDPTRAVVAARADITASYRMLPSGEVSFGASTVQPADLGGAARLDFGPLALGIDRITTLELDYDDAAGWEFDADLDVRLIVLPSGVDPLFFTLENVFVTERGFTIPQQNSSGFNGLSFELGAATIELLAFRTNDDSEDPNEVRGITYDWFTNDFDLNLGEMMVPEFDFIVRLPSFYGANPNDPTAEIVFNAVTFRDGRFTGAFSYAPAVDGQGNRTSFAVVPLGPPSTSPPSLAFEQVDGAFVERANGDQGLDLSLLGYLVAGAGPFTPEDPTTCPLARFGLDLVEGPGFEGTITAQDAGPCGSVDFGPVSLSIVADGQTPSTLTFAYANGEQQATFEGGVRVELPAGSENGVRATFDGTLALDLLTGDVSGGRIELQQPFTVPVPLQSANPLFTVTVSEGVLDRRGLALSGSGDLNMDEGSTVGLAFDSLRFALSDGFIQSGSATLAANVAIESPAGPFDFKLVPADPDSLTIDDIPTDGFRVDLRGAIRLDQDGLRITGDGRAGLNFASFNSPAVRVGFENDAAPLDGFTIGLGPVAITQGRAEFFVDIDERRSNTPLATLDRNGWSFSVQAAVEAVIPDTLFLPSRDVAYLVLRDEQGTLLVDKQPNLIRTLPQQTVRLSIPSLDIQTNGANPPIDVSFSARIDDAGNVTADSVGFDFGGMAMPLPNLPLTLRSGAYIRARANPFGLQADVLLPDVLNDPSSPLSVYLEVGSETASRESSNRARTAQHLAPIRRPKRPSCHAPFGGTANDPAATLAIRGLRFAFGSNQEPDLELSGDLTAKLLRAKSLDGSDEGEAAYIHLAAQYVSPDGQAPRAWQFAGSAQHLGDVPLGVATLRPNPVDGITLDITSSSFELGVAGTLRAGELLDGFAVALNAFDLTIDAADVTFSASVDASNAELIEANLFGNLATFTVPVGGMRLAADPDAVTLTINQANLQAVSDDPMELTGSNMVLSTDGGFTFDEIAIGNVPVVGDLARLERMALVKPAADRPGPDRDRGARQAARAVRKERRKRTRHHDCASCQWWSTDGRGGHDCDCTRHRLHQG